jgi:hypothetical protein
MLEAYPKAARIQGNGDNLPLLGACQREAYLDIVNMLNNLFPVSIRKIMMIFFLRTWPQPLIYSFLR